MIDLDIVIVLAYMTYKLCTYTYEPHVNDKKSLTTLEVRSRIHRCSGDHTP